jgi:aminomethyltransferase, mitochondrial
MKRVGLCEIKKGPPLRSGEKIYDTNSDECIGTVTSGCPSPSLQKNIAMGYVNHKKSKPGTTVLCEVRGKKYEWEIKKIPFVKYNYYTF